jgi:enolase
VTKAVRAVNETIAQGLAGADALEPGRRSIGSLIELDGTKNKKNLGANALLGVTLAERRKPPAGVLRDVAVPLSRRARALNSARPMMNILNGGAHSDAPIDFQEFMIMPKGAPTFAEALRYGTEVFHALKGVLKGSGPFDSDRRRRRFRAGTRLC